MTELSALPRLHDLPPKWDGRDVEWWGWSPHGNTTMVIHNPKQRCEQCGSRNEPSANPGVMDPAAGEMVEHDPIKRTKSGREYYGQTILVPARRVVRIVAFRCPDCQHDTVWDKESDEWWDLDESDYGSAGSTDPRLF